MGLLGVNARLLVELLPRWRVVFEMLCWIQSEQQPQKRCERLFERRNPEQKGIARIMPGLLQLKLKGADIVP